MILIPKEKPVVENLNSYYLDIRKLIEHYQGEIAAGVVHFSSPVCEAVLFFDEHHLLNGFLEDRKQRIHGREAVKGILALEGRSNFLVSVYRILPERLYFWANLPKAQVIYKDLTSEFTDLEGLIRKLESEKFTGYIDVALNNDEGGLLFIYNGEVIGGSATDGAGNVDRTRQYREDLIRRSKQAGGKFNVSRVLLGERKAAAAADPGAAAAAGAGPAEADSSPAARSGDSGSGRVMEMLGGMLSALEAAVRSSRKIKMDFDRLLNKKFVEKIGKYDFLDPFAAEFKYSGGTIRFTGDAGPRELVAAVTECVSEIAEANGLFPELQKRLEPWRKAFEKEITGYSVDL